MEVDPRLKQISEGGMLCCKGVLGRVERQQWSLQGFSHGDEVHQCHIQVLSHVVQGS